MRVPLAPFLITLYTLALAILAAAAVGSMRSGIPIESLTDDMAYIARVSPFIGCLNNLGVVFWTAASTACLLAWYAGRRLNDQGRSRPGDALLICTAAISAYLMLDDLFLIHEDVGPRLLGVTERPFKFVYIALMGLYLFSFRRRVARREWILVSLAGGFFVVSLLFDNPRVKTFDKNLAATIEDFAKFLGIVTWFAYAWSLALRSLWPESKSVHGPASIKDGSPHSAGRAVH